MWHVLRSLAVASVLVISWGCVSVPEDTAPSATASSAPVAFSSIYGFSGATGALNIDGTRIKISWSPATSSLVAGYQVYEVTATNTNLLTTTGSTTMSYIATGLKNGSYHTYVVKAVNAAGVNDGNPTQVSALTYSGITSVTNIGNLEATVNFPSAAAATKYNVYCGAGGAPPTLMATAVPPATSATVSGLTSYTAYACVVKAVNPAGAEDGNSILQQFATRSYQGVSLVQAYGNAPNAPSPQPTASQVTIVWPAFTGATSTTQYKLVRVALGAPIDATTTTSCTSSILGSCLVCSPTGAGSQTCTDTAVAPSPQQYDYLISSSVGLASTPALSSMAWSLPTTTPTYRVTVPIPPSNMVLVQRDSANYEMCFIMNKTSDPLNHQRCSYTGLGAVPYNSNPGNPALSSLSPNYYDFGYNVFIDRWEVGCPWTLATSGGNCGTDNVTPGNCFGYGAPSNSWGANGNVYYDTDYGGCYMNIGGTWSISTSLSTNANLLVASTNAPGGSGWDIPPLTNTSQQSGWNTCRATVDPNYGPKRLMRRREFIVAAAWPIATDPGGASFTASAMVNDSPLPTTHGCNVDWGASITTGPFNTTDLAIASTGNAPGSVIIGSGSTSSCVSRTGAQDLVGNVFEFTSEQVGACTGAPNYTCLPGISIDSGDLDINNLAWDGVTGGPGGVSLGNWSLSTANSYGYKVVAPLGLPLAKTASASLGGMTLGSPGIGDFNPSYLLRDYFSSPIGSTTSSPRVSMVGGAYNSQYESGRFMWDFNDTAYANSLAGFRCALPAD